MHTCSDSSGKSTFLSQHIKFSFAVASFLLDSSNRCKNSSLSLSLFFESTSLLFFSCSSFAFSFCLLSSSHSLVFSIAFCSAWRSFCLLNGECVQSSILSWMNIYLFTRISSSFKSLSGNSVSLKSISLLK